MITGIYATEFKGQSFSIEPDQPHIAVLGPVGAGKTTRIEAFRIASGMSTRFGQTNLGRLGANGLWTVSASLRGHLFTRTQDGAKASYSVDNQKVTETEYKAKIAGLVGIGVVPDVDLGDFLSKSGQERAALFGRLLANDPVTMDAAVIAATGISLAEYVKRTSGQEIDVSDIAKVAGTPPEIVDACKAQISELNKSAKDNEATYRKLLTERPANAQSLEPLQKDLEAVNMRRGEVKHTLENLDQQIAAKNTARSNMENIEARVKALRDKASAIEQSAPEKAEQLEKMTLSLKGLRADAEGRESAIEAKAKDIAELKARVNPAAPGDPFAGIDTENLTAPPDNVLAEFAARYDIPTIAGLQQVWTDLVALIIRPWIQASRAACKEAIGAHASAQAKLQVDISSSSDSLNRMQAEVEAVLKEIRAKVAKIDTLTREIESDRKLVISSRDEADKLDQQRAGLAAIAQKAVVTTDEEATMAEQANLDKRAADLERSIRDAQKAAQIAGQIDRASLMCLRARAMADSMKKLLEFLQEWRDRVTKAGMDAVLAPFRAAVDLVLPGYGVDIHIGGSGRSTQFDFRIVFPAGKIVSLDQLSGGETLLVGAAFLSAMHTIMGSQARLVTMDAEALDAASLRRVLEAIPKLGFEASVIANNRLVPSEVPEGWFVVDCAAAVEATA